MRLTSIVVLIASSATTFACVSDVIPPDGGKADGGAGDGGCSLPNPMPGVACGQTNCGAAASCCVYGATSVQCKTGDLATVCADAGFSFQWGCDKQADCNGRTCCIQSPVMSGTCPVSLVPSTTHASCQDLCTGGDLWLCANDLECSKLLGNKKCKPAVIPAGGSTKVVGVCL
jgi:hypothetical protein